MRVIITKYIRFRGEWEQPGNEIDITKEEAQELEAQGAVTVRTQMARPPARRTKNVQRERTP